MSLLNAIRRHIKPLNPLLLMYHKTLAVLAALVYRFPAEKLKVVAITGTKGKSTVALLLAKIFEEAGLKVGVISTVRFQIGSNVWTNDTKMTTPGRFKLQKFLRKMVDDRCDVAIVESTSQALIQSRLWGVNVDTAVLTNMQTDHLEYHGGFENYLHAKGLLFRQLSRANRKGELSKTAVLPCEDSNFAYFDSFLVDHKITFGLTKGQITAQDIELEPDSTRFVLKVPNDSITVHIKLPGEFNVLNALSAASAAISLGVKLPIIKRGLEQFESMPGMLESINVGQPFNVLVDYAHTEESLKGVLSFLKPLTRNKLFVVFGATGGGRDKAKRPRMGKIVDELADYIVVTDDDPYEEDRMKIMEQIAEGIDRKEGEDFWMVRDRRQGIRLALSMAGDGDTVVICGKGSEPVQVIGTEHLQWDDRRVAKEILTEGFEVKL